MWESRERGGTLRKLQYAVEAMEPRLLLSALPRHITSDLVLSDTSTPYVLNNDLYIDPGVKLTLAAGVTLRSASRSDDVFVEGTLAANDARIELVGTASSGGDRSTLTVSGNGALLLEGGSIAGNGQVINAATAQLQNVAFESVDGTANPAASPIFSQSGGTASLAGISGLVQVQVQADGLSVTGSQFASLEVQSGSAHVVGNTITGARPVLLDLAPEQLPQVDGYASLMDQNTFTAGKVVTVEITSSGTLGDDRYHGLANATVVYLFNLPQGGSIDPAGDTVTYDPGIVVKMGKTWRENGFGHLIINGTPQRPVIMTSLEDDTAGGDSLLDGATTGTPGDWVGIEFSPQSTGDLENVQIRYAQTAVNANASNVQVKLQGATLINSSRYGIYAYTPGVEIDAENCLVANNRLSGVFVRADSMGDVFRNCTIVGNGFGGSGRDSAGIHVGATTVLIENCIIAFNNNGLFHGDGADPSNMTVDHTLFYTSGGGSDIVWNGDPGMPRLDSGGNVQADPGFVDLAGGDYTLRANSPALDAGNSALATLVDLSGLGRFDDPGIANLGIGTIPYMDLGAFERELASPPVDLKASGSSWVAGASPKPGDSIQVSWTVINGSANDATGSWSDTVLLSTDQNPSPDDLVLAQVQRASGLGAGQSYNGAWTGVIPSGAAGPMYVLVMVNRPRGSGESNYQNDLTVATSQLAVGTPDLSMGTPLNAGINKGAWQYYRLVTPAAQDTLLFTLLPEDKDRPYLYVANGRAPTADSFDGAGQPQPDGSLLVSFSNVPAGAVYFVGVFSPVGHSSFKLTASAPSFGIRAVSPRSAANAGQITLTVSGAGFSPSTTAQLVRGNTSIPGVVNDRDAGLLTATFQLGSGVAQGVYTLTLTNAGTTVRLEDVVSLSPATAANFTAAISLPGLARPGHVVTATVTYRNASNADLRMPLLVLHGPQGSSWRVGPADTWLAGADFAFLPVNPTGRADVLGPGQSGTVTVQLLTPDGDDQDVSIALDHFGADLGHDDDEPIDWTAIEPLVRPAVTDADWPSVYATMTSAMGGTWGSFLGAMRTNLIRRAAMGASGASLSDLLWDQMGRAVVGNGVSMIGALTSDDGTATGGTTLRFVNQETGAVTSAAVGGGGTFVTPFLTPGTYLVSVSGVVYASAMQVTAGASDVYHVVIPVHGGSSIHGALQLPDGRTPVAGGTIRLESGSKTWTMESDAAGDFDFAGLEPGDYVLTAAVHGQVRAGAAISLGQKQAYDAGTIVLAAVGSAVIQVQSAAGGAAIAAAQVTLISDTGQVRSGTTDAQGRVELDDLLTGQWSVGISSPSFEVEQGHSLLILADAQATWQASLAPAGQVHGMIQAGGAAVEGAVIILTSVDGQGTALSAVSGEDGTYSVASVPGGSYSAQVRAPGYALAEIAPVQVAAGAITSQDFALVPGLKISGQIQASQSGAPLAGAVVDVVQPDGTHRVARSDVGGSFELRVAGEGVYLLTASAPGRIPLRQVVDLRQGGDEALQIAMAQGVVVQGSVRLADGVSPVSAAEVRLYDAAGNLVETGTSGPDGAFELDPVPAGNYVVWADDLVDYFAPVPITAAVPGSTTADLRAGSVALHGTVRLGNAPAAGALVFVAVEGRDGLRAFTANTVADDTGAYAFPALPAGSVWLRAFDGAHLEASFVTLSGMAVEFDPVLGSAAGQLAVNVRDAGTGAAIEAATVILHPADFPAYDPGIVVRTDFAGQVNVVGMGMGSCAVTVYAEGHSTVHQEALISTAAASVEVNPGGGSDSLDVSVSDSQSKKPIPGATVELYLEGESVANAIADASGIAHFAQLPSGNYSVILRRGQALAMTSIDATPGSAAVAVALPWEDESSPGMEQKSGTSALPAAELATDEAAVDLSKALWEASGFPEAVAPPASVQELLGAAIGAPACGCAALNDGTLLSVYRQDLSGQRTDLVYRRGLLLFKYADLAHMEQEYDELLDEIEEATESARSAVHDVIFDLGVTILAYAFPLAGGVLAVLKTARAIVLSLSEFLQHAAPTDAHLYTNGSILAGEAHEAIEREASTAPGASTIMSLLDLIATEFGQLAPMAAQAAEVRNSYAAQRAQYENDRNQMNQEIDQLLSRIRDYQSLAGRSCQDLAASNDSITSCEPPSPPGVPEAPRPSHDGHRPLRIRRSKTPEDMIGPAGYDDSSTDSAALQRFVAPDQSMSYRIEFWNSPTAEVPTQDALVRNTLASVFDYSTFSFTGVGFLLDGPDGPVQWNMDLPGGQSVQTTIDMRPTFPLAVVVSGGFDPETGIITWNLHAIDPLTGESPEDASVGFLPPFDPQNGNNIGWVDYSVRPVSSLPTNSVLSNQAFVAFDSASDILDHPAPPNPPKGLGPWTNTIDADAPQSSVKSLAKTAKDTDFEVSWAGSDLGSGIAAYDIYVSDDGGAYAPFLLNTQETSARFTGIAGHTYRFFSQATDNVGNQEAAPTGPDALTSVTQAPVAHLAASNLAKAPKKYKFMVTYSDDGKVKGSTIGSGDVQVTGPKKFKQKAKLISRTPSKGNANVMTATYSLQPPGGKWDAADNGTYKVTLLGKQISDVQKHWSSSQQLGTFTVALRKQRTRPASDGRAAALFSSGPVIVAQEAELGSSGPAANWSLLTSSCNPGGQGDQDDQVLDPAGVRQLDLF